ncbi:MAG: EscU/YscU/HrcU family type III secretion system export apparatus switch protein [Alphaproteobacteria bacterium]
MAALPHPANDTAAAGKPALADRKAVALGYRPAEHDAPVVRAKGQGHIADQIIRTAEAHGIPVREDSDLAELLSFVDPGTAIPVEAFVAVAEILSYLYRLNGMPAGLADRANSATTGDQP